MPLEPVADGAHYLLGLSIIRGVPLPVVELGALLGRAPVPATSAARLVTVRVGARLAAIHVDAVIGVQSLPPGAVHELPPLLGSSALASSLGTLDRELVSVLDSGRVFADDMWPRVAGSGS
jgi:purine-binding chemotaxis protein CheW